MKITLKTVILGLIALFFLYLIISNVIVEGMEDNAPTDSDEPAVVETDPAMDHDTDIYLAKTESEDKKK